MDTERWAVATVAGGRSSFASGGRITAYDRCALLAVIGVLALGVAGEAMACTEDQPSCFLTIGGVRAFEHSSKEVLIHESRLHLPLAQVFIEDCLPNFEGPVSNFVRAVNALNDGKGLGVNAGSPAPKCAVRTCRLTGPAGMSACPPHLSVRYFYRLRWSAATYKRGQLRQVGLGTAEALFPQVADAHSFQ
jgi:hypothetical protein